MLLLLVSAASLLVFGSGGSVLKMYNSTLYHITLKTQIAGIVNGREEVKAMNHMCCGLKICSRLEDQLTKYQSLRMCNLKPHIDREGHVFGVCSPAPTYSVHTAYCMTQSFCCE